MHIYIDPRIVHGQIMNTTLLQDVVAAMISDPKDTECWDEDFLRNVKVSERFTKKYHDTVRYDGKYMAIADGTICAVADTEPKLIEKMKMEYPAICFLLKHIVLEYMHVREIVSVNKN